MIYRGVNAPIFYAHFKSCYFLILIKTAETVGAQWFRRFVLFKFFFGVQAKNG